MPVNPPLRETAAAARHDRMLLCVDAVSRELPTDDPDTARTRRITELLTAVREQPVNLTGWRDLARELYSAKAQTRDPWERPYDAALTGEYLTGKMHALEQANAPICDLHGPMSHGADPDGTEHDTRFFCLGVKGCTASYWWINGTHVSRSAS